MNKAFGRLIVIKKDGYSDGSCFPVTSNQIAIGRGKDCDIRFSKPNISLKQCSLTFKEDGEVIITNLDPSAAKIQVNDTEIVKAILNPGEQFVIDTRKFRFEQTDEERNLQLTLKRRTSITHPVKKSNKKILSTKIRRFSGINVVRRQTFGGRRSLQNFKLKVISQKSQLKRINSNKSNQNKNIIDSNTNSVASSRHKSIKRKKLSTDCEDLVIDENVETAPNELLKSSKKQEISNLEKNKSALNISNDNTAIIVVAKTNSKRRNSVAVMTRTSSSKSTIIQKHSKSLASNNFEELSTSDTDKSLISTNISNDPVKISKMSEATSMSNLSNFSQKLRTSRRSFKTTLNHSCRLTKTRTKNSVKMNHTIAAINNTSAKLSRNTRRNSSKLLNSLKNQSPRFEVEIINESEKQTLINTSETLMDTAHSEKDFQTENSLFNSVDETTNFTQNLTEQEEEPTADHEILEIMNNVENQDEEQKVKSSDNECTENQHESINENEQLSNVQIIKDLNEENQPPTEILDTSTKHEIETTPKSSLISEIIPETPQIFNTLKTNFTSTPKFIVNTDNNIDLQAPIPEINVEVQSSDDSDSKTPKTHVKIKLEALKLQHSTARKSARKSVRLNSSTTSMVKKLFKRDSSSRESITNDLELDADSTNTVPKTPKQKPILKFELTPTTRLTRSSKKYVTPKKINISPKTTSHSQSFNADGTHLTTASKLKTNIKENKILKTPKPSSNERLTRRSSLRSGIKLISTPIIDLPQSHRTPRSTKKINNNQKDLEFVNEVTDTPKIQINVDESRNLSSKTPVNRKSILNNNQFNLETVTDLKATPKMQKSRRSSLSGTKAINQLVETPELQKEPSLNELSDFKEVKKSITTPKIQKSPKNDLRDIRGVKKLLKTPKTQKGPLNDLSDLVGVKKLMTTPKIQRSPENDLTDIRGVKQLLRTPKPQKELLNDLSDPKGVKKLMRTPKPQKEPLNDLSDPKGVKKLMKTPRPQKEPLNDLSDPKGVKKLMKTPKPQKEPLNDLSDPKGVKKLMKTPKPQKEPLNDLTDPKGVKKLMTTPKVQKSPKNDLTDVKGIKRLLRTPKRQKEPLNDLSDVSGVKQLVSTPKIQKSPKNDLNTSNLRGVKKLMTTPKPQREPLNNLSDFEGVNQLLATPDSKSTAERTLQDETILDNDLKSTNFMEKESNIVEENDQEISVVEENTKSMNEKDLDNITDVTDRKMEVIDDGITEKKITENKQNLSETFFEEIIDISVTTTDSSSEIFPMDTSDIEIEPETLKDTEHTDVQNENVSSPAQQLNEIPTDPHQKETSDKSQNDNTVLISSTSSSSTVISYDVPTVSLSTSHLDKSFDALINRPRYKTYSRRRSLSLSKDALAKKSMEDSIAMVKKWLEEQKSTEKESTTKDQSKGLDENKEIKIILERIDNDESSEVNKNNLESSTETKNIDENQSEISPSKEIRSKRLSNKKNNENDIEEKLETSKSQRKRKIIDNENNENQLEEIKITDKRTKVLAEADVNTSKNDHRTIKNSEIEPKRISDELTVQNQKGTLIVLAKSLTLSDIENIKTDKDFYKIGVNDQIKTSTPTNKKQSLSHSLNKDKSIDISKISQIRESVEQDIATNSLRPRNRSSKNIKSKIENTIKSDEKIVESPKRNTRRGLKKPIEMDTEIDVEENKNVMKTKKEPTPRKTRGRKIQNDLTNKTADEMETDENQTGIQKENKQPILRRTRRGQIHVETDIDEIIVEPKVTSTVVKRTRRLKSVNEQNEIIDDSQTVETETKVEVSSKRTRRGRITKQEQDTQKLTKENEIVNNVQVVEKMEVEETIVNVSSNSHVEKVEPIVRRGRRGRIASVKKEEIKIIETVENKGLEAGKMNDDKTESLSKIRKRGQVDQEDNIKIDENVEEGTYENIEKENEVETVELTPRPGRRKRIGNLKSEEIKINEIVENLETDTGGDIETTELSLTASKCEKVQIDENIEINDKVVEKTDLKSRKTRRGRIGQVKSTEIKKCDDESSEIQNEFNENNMEIVENQVEATAKPTKRRQQQTEVRKTEPITRRTRRGRFEDQKLSEETKTHQTSHSQNDNETIGNSMEMIKNQIETKTELPTRTRRNKSENEPVDSSLTSKGTHRGRTQNQNNESIESNLDKVQVDAEPSSTDRLGKTNNAENEASIETKSKTVEKTELKSKRTRRAISGNVKSEESEKRQPSQSQNNDKIFEDNQMETISELPARTRGRRIHKVQSKEIENTTSEKIESPAKRTCHTNIEEPENKIQTNDNEIENSNVLQESQPISPKTIKPRRTARGKVTKPKNQITDTVEKESTNLQDTSVLTEMNIENITKKTHRGQVLDIENSKNKSNSSPSRTRRRKINNDNDEIEEQVIQNENIDQAEIKKQQLNSTETPQKRTVRGRPKKTANVKNSEEKENIEAQVQSQQEVDSETKTESPTAASSSKQIKNTRKRKNNVPETEDNNLTVILIPIESPPAKTTTTKTLRKVKSADNATVKKTLKNVTASLQLNEENNSEITTGRTTRSKRVRFEA